MDREVLQELRRSRRGLSLCLRLTESLVTRTGLLERAEALDWHGSDLGRGHSLCQWYYCDRVLHYKSVLCQVLKVMRRG
jgi:hypothetical protein